MVDLRFLNDIIAVEGEKILTDAASKLRRLAREEAPVDSGLLANSHTIESPNRKTRIIGPDASILEAKNGRDYAPDVYFGTKPHKIKVKNARVLTNGTDFFGREVNHPGTKANRWLERALARLVI